jgi:hypothetical protein
MAPSNTREGIYLALEGCKKCIGLARETFKQYPFFSIILIVGVPALRVPSLNVNVCTGSECIFDQRLLLEVPSLSCSIPWSFPSSLLKCV